jgi:hypothetical protein
MRSIAILAALAVSASLGACGSEQKSDRDPVEDFQRRAGEICTDVNDRIVAMEARIQEQGRTERDRSKAVRLDESVYRHYARFIGDLVGRLERLEVEAPDKPAFRDYLERLRKLRRASRTMWDRPSVAALNAIGPQVEQAEDQADRLRLGPCGELSNPTLTGAA